MSDRNADRCHNILLLIVVYYKSITKRKNISRFRIIPAFAIFQFVQIWPMLIKKYQNKKQIIVLTTCGHTQKKKLKVLSPKLYEKIILIADINDTIRSITPKVLPAMNINEMNRFIIIIIITII